MTSRHRLETRHGDQGPVVVKTATDRAGRAHLEREAARLDRARHPGIVELLSAGPDDLVLAWAGDRTLELERPPLPVAAGLLAAVASTVADLHELGIVHGRLDPTHVIIGPDGRPRLCGLRGLGRDEPEAGPADDVAAVGRLIDHLLGSAAEPEPIPERRWARRRWTGYARRSLLTVADQAAHEDPARRPTARALALLIADAVPDARLRPTLRTTDPAGTADPEAIENEETEDPVPREASEETEESEEAATRESIEETEESATQGGPAEDDPAEEDPAGDEADDAHVADVASSATEVDHPVPGLPPSAPEPRIDTDTRARTDALPDGDPTVGDGPDPDLPPATKRAERTPAAPEPPLPARRAAAVAAIVLVSVVVLAGWVHGRESRRGQFPAPNLAVQPTSAPPPPTTVRTTTTTTTGAPHPSAATAGACPPPATSSADIDGDGCPDRYEVHGTSIQVDERAWAVGDHGDLVAVGDWDCDGLATPAIVRPATGEVYVFSRWAEVDEPVTVAPAAVVAGARSFGPAGPSGTCGPPRVRVDGGGLRTVSPKVARP